MIRKPSDIAAELKQAWESEIRLVERIQRVESLPDEAEKPGEQYFVHDLPEIMSQLVKLRSSSSELQEEWKRHGGVDTDDLIATRERKRRVLIDAIELIRQAELIANTNKQRMLKQLSEANRVQVGLDRYRRR